MELVKANAGVAKRLKATAAGEWDSEDLLAALKALGFVQDGPGASRFDVFDIDLKPTAKMRAQGWSSAHFGYTSDVSDDNHAKWSVQWSGDLRMNKKAVVLPKTKFTGPNRYKDLYDALAKVLSD